MRYRSYHASRRSKLPKRVTGIEPRHARSCPAKAWDEAGVCTCTPSFQASVFIARDRKLVRKTFPTLAAAKSWRADSQHSVKRGTMSAPTKKTIGEALDALLAGMRDGTIRSRNRRPFKPSVIRTYETWIEARLRPEFGSYKLADVRRNDIQDFVERLIAEGRDASTIRNILMPLRVLYRRAIERGEVIASPLTYLDLPAIEGRRERVADPEEAEALLDALPENDRALWATALYSGLRKGELRALRVEDIDLDKGVVRVERSWDDVTGVIEPKSKAGARKVPLCSHLRGYLQAHLADLGRDAALVFGETATRPFDYGKTTRRAYSAWRAAGLNRITLHECRHSFRTYLDYAGVSEIRCNRYLGHSNRSLGARYSHALTTQLAADADALDAFLDSSTSGRIFRLAATA